VRLRDHVGRISIDKDVAGMSPKEGQPADAPWRRVLVCVMPFLENLSDRPVAVIEKRPRSQERVPHVDQWKAVSTIRRDSTPLGHVQPAPEGESRSLQE
jgi:hypothetical protein